MIYDKVIECFLVWILFCLECRVLHQVGRNLGCVVALHVEQKWTLSPFATCCFNVGHTSRK